MKGLLVVVVALIASVAYGAITPYGRVDDECMWEVPHGSQIHETSDGRTVVMHSSYNQPLVLTGCKKTHPRRRNVATLRNEKRGVNFPPNYDGWLAYTAYNTSAGTFDTFLGNFSVPANPQNAAQVLYIFTGLQSDDWVPIVDPPVRGFDIIQPVLQYPADSGSDWSVKSWYVTLGSDVLYTPEVPCRSGDVIFGNMSRTTGNTWFIGGTVTRTRKTAGLTVTRDRLKLQPWAFTTVECYGCNDCTYLPTNTLHFSGMSLSYRKQPIVPVWTAYTSPNDICNTQAHINSAASVDYTFQ